MQFIYFAPGRWLPINPSLMSGKVNNRLAIVAEQAGYYGICLDQHPAPVLPWLSGPGGHHCFDPFIGLASAAAVTTTLRVMPYLAVLPYYNPFHFAKLATTLDVFSDGRLILGCGVGYMKGEYEALGVDFDTRNQRFMEVLDVFRKASSGEPVSYEGSDFTARDVVIQPVSVQRPHPPIWLGGNSKLTRRRVAEFAQGWLPMPLKRGREADHSTPVLETVDDLRGLLVEMHDHAARIGRTDPIDIVISSGLIPPGTPFDEQCDILREYARLGVTGVTANGLGTSAEEAEDYIVRFGEEVIKPLNG